MPIYSVQRRTKANLYHDSLFAIQRGVINQSVGSKVAILEYTIKCCQWKNVKKKQKSKEGSNSLGSRLQHRRASGAARHLTFGTNNPEKWIGPSASWMRWVGAYAVGTVRIFPGQFGSTTNAGHHV
ncbi:uncharacterized protein PpBr36_10670 [Pyricularia pennisetigena]|uniref:uncharacterized protein n=1 Tax=Pyricularia pennisetigena TaxID=1578925 RepID=UPI001150933A|nr:uncharacterized protein PpBr36_10670 [Pyricularia pennisetigena]TLS20867.1 hypothetical protein PpBr36_10670 [Pyricularia pennisetigena]